MLKNENWCLPKRKSRVAIKTSQSGLMYSNDLRKDKLSIVPALAVATSIRMDQKAMYREAP